MPKRPEIIKLEGWLPTKWFDTTPTDWTMESLVGHAFGHPRFKDGHPVVTSAIFGKEGNLVRTISGSLYELGTPDKLFAEHYPDPKEKLLNCLHDVTSKALPVHVDDWIDTPANYLGEKLAKEWFAEFRKPAIRVNYKWLALHRVTCFYKGSKFRCIGASRFGDVWLTSDLEKENGYDKRVNLADCSDWQVEVLNKPTVTREK